MSEENFSFYEDQCRYRRKKCLDIAEKLTPSVKLYRYMYLPCESKQVMKLVIVLQAMKSAMWNAMQRCNQAHLNKIATHIEK